MLIITLVIAQAKHLPAGNLEPWDAFRTLRRFPCFHSLQWKKHLLMGPEHRAMAQVET